VWKFWTKSKYNSLNAYRIYFRSFWNLEFFNCVLYLFIYSFSHQDSIPHLRHRIMKENLFYFIFHLAIRQDRQRMTSAENENTLSNSIIYSYIYYLIHRRCTVMRYAQCSPPFLSKHLQSAKWPRTVPPLAKAILMKATAESRVTSLIDILYGRTTFYSRILMLFVVKNDQEISGNANKTSHVS